MSRAYRIRVRESVRREVRAEDHVTTTLELLEILPCDAMAGLLRDELIGRGFVEEGGTLVRRGEDGLSVAVDPASGEVTVRSEAAEEVELKAERAGWADTDSGRPGRAEAEEALRQQLRRDLESKADGRADGTQRQATDRLEAALGDLRAELDRVVNRVTAEALKRKAAQIGRIKEMTEDPEAGSLTLVVEV